MLVFWHNIAMNNAVIYENLASMHPDAKCELNYTTPFELLVAVILSAQCTDKRVNEVTKELFKVYNKPEDYARLTPEQLKPYVFSCGFYNNKATNIIAASKAIVKDYGGEVPSDFDALTSLAGVGRKTASVVTAVAFGLPAMPVDTHVFRVARRIGIASGDTVEKVETELKEGFPKERWNSLHHYLIFHGRYLCKSRAPLCEKCLLRDVCKFEDKK